MIYCILDTRGRWWLSYDHPTNQNGQLTRAARQHKNYMLAKQQLEQGEVKILRKEIDISDYWVLTN